MHTIIIANSKIKYYSPYINSNIEFQISKYLILKIWIVYLLYIQFNKKSIILST